MTLATYGWAGFSAVDGFHEIVWVLEPEPHGLK